MERYVCIHGHFYQPPRENPWLEEVEQQDSAYPYHDWNERIAMECYAPNGASRILDAEGRIARIVNNYARISFNFGPTLLSWMERHAPDTYAAVLEADRESRQRFWGHGSAMAQAYNHMILPLATRRDKVTQVVWGLRDFERRFGRPAEGMWLPETAVDGETLDILAERGMRFAILAPHQARRVRPIGQEDWTETEGGKVDPRHPYRVSLPSGRSIAVFFYDGPVSRAVAFERILDRGEEFAGRLAAAFDEERETPQMVHIATDGETYGHHHAHGDMALAYALEVLEAKGLARLTNYAEFLERHPPAFEAEIVENSSWSCAHGVERWRADCGCRTGGKPGWTQAWRGPLRAALDWLRDELVPIYEQGAAPLLRDPWAARDAYIDVVLDRSQGSLERFWVAQAAHPLNEADAVRALMLLEMQRNAILMYTSCGWFFDELTGIETVQVIRYAGRAIQLAERLASRDIASGFLDRLALAKSNLPEHGDGAAIYRHWVAPATVGLAKVAAHYAISSLFEEETGAARVYCYDVERLAARAAHQGRARLRVGRASVRSRITGKSRTFAYGVVHFGDQNLSAGVRVDDGETRYQETARELEGAFAGANYPELVRLLDRHFGTSTYSLRSLFRDPQRRILDRIIADALQGAEGACKQVHDQHAALMRFLVETGFPLPPAFRAAAETALNARLRKALSADLPDPDRIGRLLDEAKRLGLALDAPGLSLAFQRAFERAMDRLAGRPDDLAALEAAETMSGLVGRLPFGVNLWRPQNLCFRLGREAAGGARARAEVGDEEARAWLGRFARLAERLSVRADGGS